MTLPADRLSVDRLVMNENVRSSRPNSKNRNLFETLLFDVLTRHVAPTSVPRSPSLGLDRKNHRSAAHLADASSRTLSPRVPGRESKGRLLPRSLPQSRACNRGNAAAFAAVRSRRRDRVLRHSDGAPCTWAEGRVHRGRRSEARAAAPCRGLGATRPRRGGAEIRP